MRKTKIVATIGPSSFDKEVLRKMVAAGMNVARLNFSHGELETHRDVVNNIRELSVEFDKPVAILGDIQGPRIRTKTLEDVVLEKDEEVWIADVSHGVGELEELKGKFFLLDQPGILGAFRTGDAVLVADGVMQLVVTACEQGIVRARAVTPGTIQNHKGVNLPDSPINLPVITPKDRRDLEFIVAEQLDYVGLSFVGSAADIHAVREMMQEFAGSDRPIPKVVAKIERKEAMKHLKSIVRTTDAVMVARGDLGIELPESEVAIFQKQIIAESLKQVRPVIVATQMLRSMTENPRPTRAEVSDVTNAVIDHADAVMLSEESASGKYPVESVAMLREIADKTEESPFDDVYRELDTNLRSDFAVVVRSVYQLARSYDARAIVLTTRSGFTANLLSHFRPEGRLLVGTLDRRVWQALALVWGVDAYLFEGHTGTDGLAEEIIRTARKEKHLVPGDRVVVCLGRDAHRDTLQLVGVREIEED